MNASKNRHSGSSQFLGNAGLMQNAIRILCFGIMLLGYPNTSWSSDRGEELSGEHEEIETTIKAPGIQEPERDKAGADKDRPTLKLPDVVVRGDKQYRVTAERRDLLLMDPMWGTKEMPEDFGKVAVPGLEDDKNAPTAETITAKNYLFSLEAGAGTQSQLETQLIVGYELESVGIILRSDYLCGEHPYAYGFKPFDQIGTTDFTMTINAVPLTKLSFDLIGKGATSRQPDNQLHAWGEWLERTFGKAVLRGEIEITPHSKFNLTGALDQFEQRGIGSSIASGMQVRTTNILAEFEQDIQGLTIADFNILVGAEIITQAANMDTFGQTWNETETLRKIYTQFRFRPVNALHIDLGVRIDDFAGVETKSTSEVIGQASLVLPTGSVFYGSLESGLDWKLVSEWGFEQPHPSRFWLPEPESILGSYQAGWRQRFSEQFSGHIAWFRREMEDISVWIDGDKDGLFTLVNLTNGKIEGVQVEIETRYTQQITQIFKYTFQEAISSDFFKIPNLAKQEGFTELQLELGRANFAVHYRYLGERFGDPVELIPGLKAAHLLGARCDVPLVAFVNVFVVLENILGYTWEEWIGYPGRGVSVLAGARVSF